MSEQIQNTFNKGLNLDTSNYQTPSSMYTYAENITFVTHNGEEMILQNEKGNTYVASLKEDYVPIATKSYGEICYIVSAQVVNNKFTGKGEIGSFPSPDYDNLTDTDCTDGGCNYTGKLVNEYKPFMNYGGDAGTPINSSFEVGYGEFTSDNFNFQRDKPVEIVSVQPSYDGTVNVIFTDDFNKPKLINSRFTVRPGKNIEIINRQGSNDTNLYVADNFNNRLNHIYTTNKLTSVTFDGQQTGGNLPTGLYKYLFKYSTVDGNETNFIAESFNVPVFFGDSVATTRGGITNENTDKINILTLHNVDTAYSQVNVYFSYSSGTVGADAQEVSYKLSTPVDIEGPSVEIRHTGFENQESISVAELSLSTASIDTYKTGCEVKGRLAVANIQEKEYDVNLLRDFAKDVKIFTATKKMGIKGFDVDKSHLAIYSRINYGSTLRDTFEGAYYNPRNVHDNLGYWGGETYMFGISFLFDDGSSTAVIPVRGLDNLNNNAVYSTNQFIDDDFDDNTGENVRGVYRFPSRTTQPYIVGQATSSYVNLYFPEFDVPDLTDEIKSLGVVGYRFHRSRRKIDCVGQGIMINTFLMPTTDGIDFGSPPDGEASLADYYLNNNGYKESNSRFFPAYNYISETLSRKAKVDNENRRRPSTPDVEDQGIEPVQLCAGGFTGDQENFWFNKKFAFISPDFICNPINNSRLYNTNSFSLSDLGSFNSIYALPCPVPFQVKEGTGAPWVTGEVDNLRYFSVIKSSQFNPSNSNNFTECSTEYVTGQSAATTEKGFTSSINTYAKFRYQLGNGIVYPGDSNVANSVDYGLLHHYYNDYVGITTEAGFVINPSYPLSLSQARTDIVLDGTQYNLGPTTGLGSKVDGGRVNTFNFTNGVTTTDEGSRLVNIYRGSGPRTLELIKELYQPEYESFYSISQPIYNDDEFPLSTGAGTVDGILQSKPNLINSNGRLEATNGDCFINLTHRRLFTSGRDRTEVDDPGFSATNVGYTLAFIAESNYNVAGRYENIVDLNEGIRSFAPYTARNHKPAITNSSVKGEDDDWRVLRLPETTQYNTGYDKLENGKIFPAITLSNPFIQKDFSTRVWISDPYISSSFDNAYRSFQPLAYENYPRYLGEIISIKSYRGNIFCVHEFGTTLIPVSERVAQTGDSAGKVFFESSEVLAKAENIQYISELHGSQWQFSVLQTDNAIYGVDMNTTKIWQFTGGALKLISDAYIQSFLKNIQDSFIGESYEWFYKQIRTYYDNRLADVIFTFASAGGNCPTIADPIPATCATGSGNESGFTISGGDLGDPNNVIQTLCYDGGIKETLIYNEIPSMMWKSFASWKPINHFTIHDKVYSIPLEGSRNKIYEHYTNELRSTYYESSDGFVIEYVATLSTLIHQIYENIKIVGRHIYPSKIEYTTDEGTFVSTIRPETPEKITANYGQREFESTGGEIDPAFSQIQNYNASIKEDHVYIQIVKDLSDTYNLDQVTIDNKKVRDKFCKIRIFYDTTDSNLIQAIFTAANKN